EDQPKSAVAGLPDDPPDNRYPRRVVGLGPSVDYILPRHAIREKRRVLQAVAVLAERRRPHCLELSVRATEPDLFHGFGEVYFRCSLALSAQLRAPSEHDPRQQSTP